MQTWMDHAIGAAKLDRNVWNKIYFEEYATANAVMVVAIIAIVQFLGVAILGGGSILSNLFRFDVMLSVAIGALFEWIIAAAALWVMGVKVFGGSARLPSIIAMVGYAYVPFLLLAFLPIPWLGFDLPGAGQVHLFFVVAVVWFTLALRQIGEVHLDLKKRDALAAAVVAAAVWLAVRAIF
ncbi:MAG: YIP1 family protein [Acidimicrobiia bacterium]|nr:YIP1 family protein [Acidimicrobiia bacterium]